MNASVPARPDREPGTRRNGKAIWSLILGILGIWPLIIVGPILAISLGRSARREITAASVCQSGSGMANAGILLGWIGLAVTAAAVLTYVASDWSGIPG